MSTKTKNVSTKDLATESLSNNNGNGMQKNERLEVLKTYKVYIGGKFPRTESGRYYKPTNSKGEILGNICLSSRKDVRNSVVAARKAFTGWSGATAFNKSQILYRIAEMLETRKAQFIEEIVFQGSTEAEAKEEVAAAVETFVYYAGWADKFQQVFSSVNPVSGSYFNFSAYEPMGVVGIIAPENNSLLGLAQSIAPAIVGGNTVVVLASESKPLCSITLSEVFHTSDVPGGVINVLTGKLDELVSFFGSHMDVNAVSFHRESDKHLHTIQELAVDNIKRVKNYTPSTYKTEAETQNPYKIIDLQEVKTTWHPIEVIGASGSGY